jgi:hypothetical protein
MLLVSLVGGSRLSSVVNQIVGTSGILLKNSLKFFTRRGGGGRRAKHAVQSVGVSWENVYKSLTDT